MSKTLLTSEDISNFRRLQGEGMISAVGEYTPDEFWQALDTIDALREVATLVLSDPGADQSTKRAASVALAGGEK